MTYDDGMGVAIEEAQQKTTIRRYDMFAPVKRNNSIVYADPFAHIFEQFFGDVGRGYPIESRLSAQFEIVETDKDYTIAAELPGIGKENVEIIVDEDVLTVRGEKKIEEKQQGKSYLLASGVMARSSGSSGFRKPSGRMRFPRVAKMAY